MSDTPLKTRIQRQQICSGCGKELDSGAELDEKLRAYCERCKELGQLKENWMPFNGSCSIHGVFVIPDSKRRD